MTIGTRAKMLGVLGLVLLAAVPAAAQTRLRFARTISTEDSMHLAALELAKKVEQKTGGAVRMRLYGAAGVEPTPISRAIAFGTISFGIGTGVMAAIALVSDASGVAPVLHLPSGVLRVVAAVWLLLVAAFLAACAGRFSWARAVGRVVPLPHVGLAAWQLLVSAADIVFAAAALWWLLPPSNVSPVAFVGFFAVATLLGVVSHSPGGGSKWTHGTRAFAS